MSFNIYALASECDVGQRFSFPQIQNVIQDVHSSFCHSQRQLRI